MNVRSSGQHHETMPSSRRRRPRRRALGPLAALVSVTCTAGAAGHARADETGGPCASAPVPVSIGGGLGPEWLEATREVCGSLGRLRDLDRSARLTIEASARAGEVRVRVDLADGRSAVREVALPAHLLHVVEGLVTMPPAPTAPPPPPPPAPAPPAPAPPAPAAPAKPPAKRPPSAVAATPSPRGEATDEKTGLAHVEVGAQVVGRLAGSPGYGSVGLALAGDVHVDGWLVGLAARWDPAVLLLEDPPEDFEMTSFGGGLEVGRRLPVHEGIDLDVGLGLHVLGELQSMRTPGAEPEEEGEERGDREGPHTTATAFDVRAQPWVQLHLGEGSVRPTATLAFEVSPLRAGRDLTASPGLPALPSWGFSLGLGASWDGP